MQARPGLRYMLGLERGLAHSYELFPSMDNFRAALASLLRTTAPVPVFARRGVQGKIPQSHGLNCRGDL